MLQVVSLKKSFDGKPVLKGINLHVKQNDILAFVGGNGAGKSTTLNIITGIIEEDDGIIQINGINKSPSVDYKKHFFYIPDTIQVFNHVTARNWLLFLMRIYECNKIDVLNKFIQEFDLEHDLDKQVGSYSYGMLHKLALIAAFTIHPKIIIMDEPMNGLDPHAMVTFKESLNNYVQNGGTAIFSTHLLDIAEKICTKIAILKDGKIVLQDDMDSATKTGSLENIFMENQYDEY